MGGLRLGSVLGFEIRVDYSWFVIVFLILWSFSFGVFPQTLPGYERSVYLAMGAVGAVLFFASLLAHELSHSVVARAKGIPVEGITLFIFGGMARTRMEAETPGDELAIAGVGPLASLVIAGLFTVLWWVGVRTGTAAAPVAEVARYLAVVNVVLAVFNLLPGFPLDGGRLFRALVWKVTGDLTRATRWASWGGQALGFALMALGALQAMSGMVLGGMWLVFIGWFLRTAAAFSFRQHVVREMLTGVRARDLMTPSPHSVSSDLTIDELVERHILLQRHYGFPVLDEDRLVGLVTLEDVKRTPRAEWGGKRVRDIMGTDGALIVSPDAPVTEVLERLQGAGAGHLVVARGGHVEGIVASSDVARWIQREQELGSLVATR